MAPSNADTDTLPRSYGLRDATLVGLSAIIGSGIFIALGPAAQFAGPAVLLSLVVAVIPAMLNGLASAALGATFPKAGGTYHFGRQVLGPRWGFAAGWAFLIAKLCSGAAMAQGFGRYLTGGTGVSAEIVSLGLVLLVTLADLRGPKVSKTVNALLVTLKVGILLMFALVGVWHGHFVLHPLSDFAPHGWRGVWQGAAILFSVYAGYARIATLAEEVQEPRHTLPRAVCFSLGGSFVLYMLVALGLFRLTGLTGVSSSPAPLADALSATGLPTLAKIVSAGATIASGSAFLVLLTGISRVMFAMGRAQDLPAVLSAVSKDGVPAYAVIASGIVVALLTLIPEIATLLAVNSAAILFYYTITNICALRLSPTDRRYPAVFCVFGAACCLLLIAGLPLWQLLATATVLIAGVAAHILSKRVAGHLEHDQ